MIKLSQNAGENHDRDGFRKRPGSYPGEDTASAGHHCGWTVLIVLSWATDPWRRSGILTPTIVDRNCSLLLDYWVLYSQKHCMKLSINLSCLVGSSLALLLASALAQQVQVV